MTVFRLKKAVLREKVRKIGGDEGVEIVADGYGGKTAGDYNSENGRNLI
jgi:hypothetical protein